MDLSQIISSDICHLFIVYQTLSPAKIGSKYLATNVVHRGMWVTSPAVAPGEGGNEDWK